MDIQKAIKLLPCPFCGSEAELKDHGKGTGGWMISCSNHNNTGGMCGVLMVCPATYTARTSDEIHESGKVNTIKAWNKRQALAALSSEPDLLKNFLAVIHRDGGHHTTEVGLEQSIEDAKQIYYQLRDKDEVHKLSKARGIINGMYTVLENDGDLTKGKIRRVVGQLRKAYKLMKDEVCKTCGDEGKPCSSCGEFHIPSVMCPPHEVRFKGRDSINAPCPVCGKTEVCKTCNGKGKIIASGSWGMVHKEVPCPDCRDSKPTGRHKPGCPFGLYPYAECTCNLEKSEPVVPHPCNYVNLKQAEDKSETLDNRYLALEIARDDFYHIHKHSETAHEDSYKFMNKVITAIKELKECKVVARS